MPATSEDVLGAVGGVRGVETPPQDRQDGKAEVLGAKSPGVLGGGASRRGALGSWGSGLLQPG